MQPQTIRERAMDGKLIDLSGQRALVTGGSRGIGRATAILLARAEAEVGIGYHRATAEAESACEEIREAGGRAWAQAADLSEAAGAAALFERVDREFEGLDIFVANAGIWTPDHLPITELEEDEWRRTMEINVTAVYRTVRAAVDRMSEPGRIVIVSSTAGQRGEAGHSQYAASKGALISFVKSLAVELGPRGVTVNAVAPGWVDTDMAAPALESPAERDRVLTEIPLGRLARPEDVAGPIVFLCSELARHITGEVLNVNGGSVLCG